VVEHLETAVLTAVNAFRLDSILILKMIRWVAAIILRGMQVTRQVIRILWSVIFFALLLVQDWHYCLYCVAYVKARLAHELDSSTRKHPGRLRSH